MLRALRFASVYGMTIEAATAAAIHRNKHLLKGIAAERILVELTKMLCAQGAAGVLRDFADVLAVPIPELTPMFGFPQHNPHHDKDVWDHTIAVIESITPEPVLRWAALLHDIGKPSCFSLAEDGIGHFFGHSDQSTSMAESILSRLRFDNASKEQIVRLVRYHDMPITADRKPIKRLLSKHGEDATRQLIELHKADIAYSFALGTSYESGFVGLTGVPSYSQFERALEELNSIGVVRINIMVDSDYQVKEEVRKARDRYIEMGVAAGFEVAPITWTQKRKGVDDLYKHLFRNK